MEVGDLQIITNAEGCRTTPELLVGTMAKRRAFVNPFTTMKHFIGHRMSKANPVLCDSFVMFAVSGENDLLRLLLQEKDGRINDKDALIKEKDIRIAEMEDAIARGEKDRAALEARYRAIMCYRVAIESGLRMHFRDSGMSGRFNLMNSILEFADKAILTQSSKSIDLGKLSPAAVDMLNSNGVVHADVVRELQGGLPQGFLSF